MGARRQGVILIGELSLWVALVMAAWATGVSYAGGALRRSDMVASGARGMFAAWGFTVLASAGLLTALVRHDFSFRYVASYTSVNLPVLYTVAALWSGPSGSLLFGALLVSSAAAMALAANRRTNCEHMPWVAGTLGAVLVCCLAVTAFGANPYDRLDWIVADGRGMRPQLQQPGMAIYLPMLGLARASATVSFAFAVAALITRRLDADWIAAVRRWALTSWCFLTVATTLGIWCGYVDRGWGSDRAWDLVENGSLLPWLTGTAFLHASLALETRGLFRRWTVTLAIATFLLSILDTVIVHRGGVDAFAQSAVVPWIAGLVVVALAASALFVTSRLDDLVVRAELESMLSREAALLYSSLLLAGIACVVLWGTLVPVLSEAATRSRIAVDPAMVAAVSFPLGLVLIALTGIVPLTAWRRTSPANLRQLLAAPLVGALVVVGAVLFGLGVRETYAVAVCALAGFVAIAIAQDVRNGTRARVRMNAESAGAAFVGLVLGNRRQYGGYLVHAGIVLVAAAFAALPFRTGFTLSLAPGETFTAKDPYGHVWSFTSGGLSRFDVLNRRVLAVSLITTRDGRPERLITAERRQSVDSRGEPIFEPVTEAGILAGLRQDVYVVLTDVSAGERVGVRIVFNPLVVWVWFGGIAMAFGGLVALWPAAPARRGTAAVHATPLKPAYIAAGPLT